MTDDERRLVREAANRLFEATGINLSDEEAGDALRPMLDEMSNAHATLDKAGALTHMIGNTTRPNDERASLAERIEDIRQPRDEADRRASTAWEAKDKAEREWDEMRAAREAEVRERLDAAHGAIRGLQDSQEVAMRTIESERKDAQEARDRLSRVKAAVDALGTILREIDMHTGDAKLVETRLETVERALAGDVDEKTGTLPGA